MLRPTTSCLPVFSKQGQGWEKAIVYKLHIILLLIFFTVDRNRTCNSATPRTGEVQEMGQKMCKTSFRDERVTFTPSPRTTVCQNHVLCVPAEGHKDFHTFENRFRVSHCSYFCWLSCFMSTKKKKNLFSLHNEQPCFLASNIISPGKKLQIFNASRISSI